MQVFGKDSENLILSSNYVILATGASSKNLPFISADPDLIWDYKSAMTPSKLPKSLIVIGSGAIGIEFASFYNDLGCKVTIIEVQDTILPNEDREISDFVMKNFTSRKIDILTQAELIDVSKHKNVNCKIILKGEETIINAERMLLAVGIEANVKDLGLENFDIKLKNGVILTDDWMETSEKNIYAIGDPNFWALASSQSKS